MVRTMVLLSLLAGCEAAEPPDDLSGGEIVVTECGYSVRTPDQASRPSANKQTLGADPTPFAVHLAPGRDPARSVTVVWRTRDEDTRASSVEIDGRRVEGFTFYYESGGNNVRIHEAHVCNLTPDTEYTYRAGGEGAYSKDYTFRTAPDRALSPDAEIEVLLIGDTRGGYATFGQSLTEATRAGLPDLILFSGDAVSLGLLQDEWDTWFKQGEAIFSSVPLAFAHGNHEANVVNYYAQFALPGDEQNYGFDFGAVHFTVANDTPRSAGDVTGAVAQFLEAELTRGDSAPWQLTLHHKPLWSATTVHPPDPLQRAAWQPIFEKHKVAIDLTGHDHDYERSKPLKGNTPQASAAGGPIYVVVGSAGAPLYEAKSDFYTEISAMTNSYAKLHVRRGHLVFDAYRADGSSLDNFTIDR